MTVKLTSSDRNMLKIKFAMYTDQKSVNFINVEQL